MSRAKRMQPIVRITQMREEDAARELGKAQRQLKEQKDRLAELCLYRKEYLQTFQAQGSASISAVHFQEFHRFLANLEQAIEQQQLVVQNASRLCAQKNELWQQTHIKSKSMGMVVERYEEQEQYEQGRREQKDADEMAQQAARTRLLHDE
ncbi:MAG: flagellar export protein FliJ [Thiohalomonadaceae bacterium]|jgi:flagellar FliJ protein